MLSSSIHYSYYGLLGFVKYFENDPMNRYQTYFFFLLFIFVAYFLFWYFVFFPSTSSTKNLPQRQQHLQESSFFDHSMAKMKKLYPICNKLQEFEDEVTYIEQKPEVYERSVEKMIQNGSVYCGTHREAKWEGMYLKHPLTEFSDCAKKIIPAKRRLFKYLKRLCQIQHQANIQPKSYNQTLDNSELSTNQSASYTQGIIFTGKVKHFKDIYQSILSVRMLKIDWPIEIYVSESSMPICRMIFQSIHDIILYPNPERTSIQCHPISSQHFGYKSSRFAAKFYALLQTQLDHVLFLDADNIVMNEPIKYLFKTKIFQQYGVMVWPDLWGAACQGQTEMMDNTSGFTSFASHVMWQFSLHGFTYDPLNRQHVQEAEAGQVLLDLTRHKGLINLARNLIEDHEFFQIVMNGDKDLFRFIFLMTGVPFHFVNDWPGYSMYRGYRDCIIQFFQDETVETVQGTPSNLMNHDILHQIQTNRQQSHENIHQIFRFFAANPVRLLAALSDKLWDVFMKPWWTSSNPSSSTPSYKKSRFHKDPNCHHDNTTTSPSSSQHDLPIFFHQLKIRNPNSFVNYLRPPPSMKDVPTICLGFRETLGKLDYHVHLAGNRVKNSSEETVPPIVDHAKLLFEITDHEWKVNAFQYYVYWFEWYDYLMM